MHDNEKVTKNMIIRREIDSKWALSLFILLYRFIYYYKIDSKDIVDTIKLVKELV